jgi:hypothetical protein
MSTGAMSASRRGPGGLVLEVELECLAKIAQGLFHRLALARHLDFETPGDVQGQFLGDSGGESHGQVYDSRACPKLV